MPEANVAIAAVRNTVCAVLRVRRTEKQAKKKRHSPKTPATVEIEVHVSFVGTAWCIVDSKILVTAHHILNNMAPRELADHFYIVSAPANGPEAFHFPVVAFHLEDRESDTAILEVGAPSRPGQTIPAAAVTFARPPDGTHVLTIGFPAPQVSGANVNPQGEFLGGGQFFLKSHANQGILSAQYMVGTSWFYEFNVGWHHGESGGPVFRLEGDPAVFSIMQHYRNIQTPHGIHPGPHRGISLEAIRGTLEQLGAHVI
jgi:hypothetical protein